MVSSAALERNQMPVFKRAMLDGSREGKLLREAWVYDESCVLARFAWIRSPVSMRQFSKHLKKGAQHNTRTVQHGKDTHIRERVLGTLKGLQGISNR